MDMNDPIWRQPIRRKCGVCIVFPLMVAFAIAKTLWYAAIETYLLGVENVKEETDTARRVWRAVPPGTPLDD